MSKKNKGMVREGMKKILLPTIKTILRSSKYIITEKETQSGIGPQIGSTGNWDTENSYSANVLISSFSSAFNIS